MPTPRSTSTIQAMAIATQSPTVHQPRKQLGTQWWTVTTEGSTAEEHEPGRHRDARSAFDDFELRIHHLELAGFHQDGEEAAVYGRRWSRDYVRGEERVTVRVDRPLA